jgi:hypothetical protein
VNPENKLWESVKRSYLKQVEAAIKKTGLTAPREILEDIGAHLEQKFAELAPDEHTTENFEKIITDMGPVSDYVSLLGQKIILPGTQMGIWRRFAINAALTIPIIVAIIVLCQIADRLVTPYYSRVIVDKPDKPGEFTILTTETLQGRYRDNTTYPFVDDPNVIGKWESEDFVWKPDEFVPGQQHWKRGFSFHWIWFAPNQQHFIEGFRIEGLQFLPGGKMPVQWQWTKGLLLKPEGHTASRYSIKTIDGQQYMFLEWKTFDYTILHKITGYYVLKKVTDFSKERISTLEKQLK